MKKGNSLIPPRHLQILTKLYGIKAGLSAAATEAETAISGLVKIKEINKKSSLREERISETEELLFRAQANVKAQKKIKDGLLARRWIRAFVLLAIAAACYFASDIILGGILWFDDKAVLKVIINVIATLPLSVIAILGVCRQGHGKLGVAKDMYRREKLLVKKHSERLKELSKEHEIKCAAETKEKKESLTAIEETKDIIKTVLDTLALTYMTTLDRRDWQNVDCIIYLLERGECDALGDALLKIDEARRAGRLGALVNEAADGVSSVISAAIAELGGALSNHLAFLAKSITLQASARENAGGKRSSAQALRIKNLGKASNLNSCLLQQSGKSSVRLAREIDAALSAK